MVKGVKGQEHSSTLNGIQVSKNLVILGLLVLAVVWGLSPMAEASPEEENTVLKGTYPTTAATSSAHGHHSTVVVLESVSQLLTRWGTQRQLAGEGTGSHHEKSAQQAFQEFWTEYPDGETTTLTPAMMKLVPLKEGDPLALNHPIQTDPSQLQVEADSRLGIQDANGTVHWVRARLQRDETGWNLVQWTPIDSH